MALTTCPECGRENVSDAAQSCPGCGYNIKAHFDAIEQQKKNLEETQKQEEEKNIKAKQDEEKYNQRLKKVKLPKWPIPSQLSVILGILGIFIIIFGFSMILQDPNIGASYITILIGIGLLVYCYFDDYKEAIRIYHLSKSDPDAYRKYIIEQEDKERAAEKVAQQHTPIYKCPVCGSNDVNNLSSLDRFASVAMIGLASGKIGKQYKCNHCGHMW